ncbi:hypothetical protein BDW72DRAFT_183940 [Aspergillus terricola var. indicus]
MNALLDRAHILRLPDELLESILWYACPPVDGARYKPIVQEQREKRYSTLASWCLICWRLYPLAMSLLYGDLVVGCSPPRVQRESVSKLLHRSCRQNPTLLGLCQQLTLNYRDHGPHYEEESGNPLYYIANDFTTLFTGVRSLTLFELRGDERAWKLLRQGLCKFRSLTELSLEHATSFDMDLWRVLDMVNELACPQLRTLALYGVTTKDSSARAKTQRKPRTSRIQSLKLRCFIGTPDDLEELVQWPEILEEFHLEFTFGDSYSDIGAYSYWSLATLQPILAIHKSTLRSIKIRALDTGGLAGFDAREFERLEELSLSSATICRSYKAWKRDDHTLSTLLGPRLRAFALDMTLEDQQHTESLNDFSEEEENWLRALCHLAVRQQLPLREIRIQFAPYEYDLYDSNSWYPWDRMDDLNREFQLHGIRVRYSPPTVSRAEFEEWIGYYSSVKHPIDSA